MREDAQSQQDFCEDFKNCFLIRHPKEVIISYAKKNNINSAYDLGYEQQVNLFKKIKEITGSSPLVFDS